jgi:tetratricopeptide (TPR) repeat protein
LNTTNTSRGSVLRKVLEVYFSEADLSTLSGKFLSKTALLLDQDMDKDLLGLRLQIDFLMTYAQRKLDKNTFIRFMIHLGEFTITAGEFNAAIEIYERILQLSRHEKALYDISANAYLALGNIYSRQAKWDMSLAYIKKANAIFMRIKDFKGSAGCENLLGTIYGDFGELNLAEDHFHKCLDLLKTTRDEALKGMVEINIGIIHNMRGNSKRAQSYLQRALIKFQSIQDKRRIAEIRYNMGVCFLKTTDYEAAIKEFDCSLGIAAEFGYLSTTALCLISKAYISAIRNDADMASALSDKAMDICFRINDRLSVAEVYKIKGIIQRLQGNNELSESYLLTSLRINNELQNKMNAAESSVELGLVYKELYKKEESSYHFSNAVNYYKKINAKEEIHKIESYLNS